MNRLTDSGGVTDFNMWWVAGARCLDPAGLKCSIAVSVEWNKSCMLCEGSAMILWGIGKGKHSQPCCQPKLEEFAEGSQDCYRFIFSRLAEDRKDGLLKAAAVRMC